NQCDSKIAGNRRDTGAALGAETYRERAKLHGGESCRIECGHRPVEDLGHGTVPEGQGEIFASARAYAVKHVVLIGHPRIDHDSHAADGTDDLHQLEGECRFIVDVQQDDVEV